jgi:hypothetical protein
MESGISHLQGIGISGNGLNVLLFAILNESLDEDLIAVKHFTELSDTSLADQFRSELNDFINIGRFVTLKEYDRLEDAGSIMIDRYTDEDNITDTLSNLYLKARTNNTFWYFKVADQGKRTLSIQPALKR